MQAEIVIAFIGVGGSILSSFFGILVSAKLTGYRLEQLEEKVNKHNSIIERIYRLEEQVKVANHRIGDLEDNEKARN